MKNNIAKTNYANKIRSKSDIKNAKDNLFENKASFKNNKTIVIIRTKNFSLRGKNNSNEYFIDFVLKSQYF